MSRKLAEAVVVITGASSGIGRATALEFARKGAAIVIAARNLRTLRAVADEVEQLGGRALVVPTDVGDAGEVDRLAERAVDEFGRIDVWVNNAAALIIGRLEEVPAEAVRRIVETNLLGVLYGSQTAVRHFRPQNRGVLINISSGFGTFASPDQATYVSTKFGVRGLSEALRMELRGTGIHVCTVMPTSIDTPVYRHTANYTGREVRPLGRVLPPEEVARTIVRLAERPKRETVVGEEVNLVKAVHKLAPGLYELLASRQVVEENMLKGAPAPATHGNLFTPDMSWTGMSGGYGPQRSRRFRRVLKAGLLASAPATAALLWLRARTDMRRG